VDETILVMPGSVVRFELKLRAVDRPRPQAAVVLRVMPGALAVAEIYSINGLARIVTHGESAKEGKYWYEYTDLDGRGTSYEVTKLSVGDQQIFANIFIE
jgi:hypothetical protein